MVRLKFNRRVRNTWGEMVWRTVTKYIVEPEEWNGIKILCDSMKGNGFEDYRKIASNIMTCQAPYEKKYENNPEMPENSVSFILYEEEAILFEELCLSLYFRKIGRLE